MSTDSFEPLFDEFPAVPTEAWEDKIRDDLGRGSYEDVLQWDAIEGITLPGYLRRDDLDDVAHVDGDTAASPLADAGALPGNAWQIRQDIAHPNPVEAGHLAERAVRGGVGALGLGRSIQRNGDAPLALWESIDDLRSVLADVSFKDVALHLDGAALTPILYAAVEDVADDRQARTDLHGSVAFDPVAALATGTVSDAETAFTLADDLVRHTPGPLRALNVDLRPYHDAGASAVQELAFGLGALTDTLTALLERGHHLPSLISNLHITTSVSTSYFVEIGKLRALRLLVPQIIDAFASESGDDVELKPGEVFVQAQTSPRTETIFDPYVNMLRGTTEAMAAVIGGSDVVNVRPFDAALRTPKAFGMRIARNVQLILAEEAHFDVVADPGAGAYYVEAATDRLAKRAWSTFQSIEQDGGLLTTLRSGSLQKRISEIRAERYREVNDRDRVMVGTNHYPDLEERRSDDLEGGLKSDAPPSDVVDLERTGLEEIHTALAEGASMSALLSAIHPETPAIDPLPRIRVGEGIEALRLRTERHAQRTGRTPTVVLAPLGPVKARSARANFARNVFGVAGFDVVEPLRFASPTEAAQNASDEGADIVVLCSADSEYPKLTPALREELENERLSPLLVVAGNPDRIDGDVPADAFIHLGAPLRDTLESIQERLGIHPSTETTRG